MACNIFGYSVQTSGQTFAKNMNGANIDKNTFYFVYPNCCKVLQMLYSHTRIAIRFGTYEAVSPENPLTSN